MTGDASTLREQYLAALEYEIESARRRLVRAEETFDEDAPGRVKVAAAVADVTLDWLVAERDRVRVGGAFDEAEARRVVSMSAESMRRSADDD